MRLSPKAEEGLLALTALPDDDLQGLATALTRSLPIKLAVQADIADVICKVRPEDSEERITVLASAIFGLHFMRAAEMSSVEQWSSDLAQTLNKDGDEASAAILRSKLAAILAVPPIQTAAKAWSLIDDHDKVYVGSRVITDVRPIFNNHIGGTLLASLVIHTLKISTRTNENVENIYAVCDNEDIRELIKSLQRALDKSAYLRRIIRDYPNQEFGAPIEGGDTNE